MIFFLFHRILCPFFPPFGSPYALGFFCLLLHPKLDPPFLFGFDLSAKSSPLTDLFVLTTWFLEVHVLHSPLSPPNFSHSDFSLVFFPHIDKSLAEAKLQE